MTDEMPPNAINLGGVHVVEFPAEPTHITGRGWVYPVTLCQFVDRDQLKAILGCELPGRGTIVGIESFAIMRHHAGDVIGLLVKEPPP